MLMARCERPPFSRSISANILLLDTKAIYMPEKKAEKSIEMSNPIMSDVMLMGDYSEGSSC